MNSPIFANESSFKGDAVMRNIGSENEEKSEVIHEFNDLEMI